MTLIKEADEPMITIENCKAMLAFGCLTEDGLAEIIDLKAENEQKILDIAEQIRNVLDGSNDSDLNGNFR